MTTMSVVKKFKPVITNPTLKHTCSIIFFHGSGDTGEGVRDWVHQLVGQSFVFENARVIYPTAPLKPYTPNDGGLSNVWFDRKQISPFVPEELADIDAMCVEMKELIEQEIKTGIPINKIFIGGFSMGGALALHVGYRFCQSLAGVFALSSFLNEDSAVYQSIKDNPTRDELPPLFQGHGTADSLVDFSWGKQTSEALNDLGVKTVFHEYKHMFHEMRQNELESLGKWIVEKIPVCAD